VASAREAAATGLDLVWDVQPLEGFESATVVELARDYDVLVLDHPHLGHALMHGSLQPLDEVFSPEDLARWSTRFVGPSLASYVLDDRLWALPLDAATQVAATRPDLSRITPRLWSEVADLSHVAPVALSLAGPHALLSFASICVALGEEPGQHDRFVSDLTGERALHLMADLAARSPRASRDLNPIGLLETMTHDDTIAHCPLVYGYVNYATDQAGREVRFTDAPRWTPGGRRGSTIGGTGLALTRRAVRDPALLDHLRWLVASATQEAFIPEHSGQPSALDAWKSARVNAVSADFYLNTLGTVSEAWVRPRHDGWIGFQTDASAVVRDVVLGESSIRAGLEKIHDLHRATAHDHPRKEASAC
jgi:multiple sugar transport system substrate-binding protein